MNATTRWGVLATVKAPAEDILCFAAHHLDIGAARVHIFLDAPNPDAFAALKSHPSCKVTVCDDAYWNRVEGRRPKKHQVRQTRNATFGYYRSKGLDWIAHIDVDEFLVSERCIADILSELPPTTKTARMRPIESLASVEGAGTPKAFKGFVAGGPDRLQIALRLYPNFGAYVKGGFVSHVAGKTFLRTGLQKVSFKIHNARVAQEQNPGAVHLSAVDIAHCHVRSWQDWKQKYRYRHDKGSYRADIRPALADIVGGVNLHTLFAQLEQDEGDAGLRRFFDEVCADTIEHRDRLRQEGLLRLHDLDLEAKMSKHFPKFGA